MWCNESVELKYAIFSRSAATLPFPYEACGMRVWSTYKSEITCHEFAMWGFICRSSFLFSKFTRIVHDQHLDMTNVIVLARITDASSTHMHFENRVMRNTNKKCHRCGCNIRRKNRTIAIMSMVLMIPLERFWQVHSFVCVCVWS